MEKLVDAFPELLRALINGLKVLNRQDFIDQLKDALVADVTFDTSADAGVIAVSAGRTLNVVERNIIGVRHGGTFSVSGTCANLDTDNFGNITGIEIVTPPALLKDEMLARARD